jgi:hypothetical protein
MKNVLIGIFSLGLLSGFSESRGNKRSIQDYIKIVNNNTSSGLMPLHYYVENENSPSILDLKNDYAKYVIDMDSSFKKWDFVELAVWRTKNGLEVLGFNYQTNLPGNFVDCPPCGPETKFFTYAKGDFERYPEGYGQDFYYWNDTKLKNQVFLKAFSLIDQASAKLDLTELLSSSWNLRYSFPRYGTTIEAYLYDGILKRSIQKKPQKPLFYLKWLSGRFVPSLTK